MKKNLILCLLSIFSIHANANISCSYLNDIADNNYYELEALTLLRVKSGGDKRVFFHSAPSKLCKQNQLFVIPSDIVTAYYTFSNENKQWIYAVYTGKNGVKTAGWFLMNSFTVIGTTALDD